MRELLALAAACLISAGCTSIHPRGTFVGAWGFAAVHLSEQRVEGRACKWVAFAVIPFGDDSIEAAWEKALADAPPGTAGLADVDITVTWPLLAVAAPWTYEHSLLLNRYCTTISGFPATRE